MDKKLTGRSIDILDYNYYFYGCADPDCPPISPEIRDYLWNAAKPQIKGTGKVFISSTAGDSKWFNEMWNNEEIKP